MTKNQTRYEAQVIVNNNICLIVMYVKVKQDSNSHTRHKVE